MKGAEIMKAHVKSWELTLKTYASFLTFMSQSLFLCAYFAGVRKERMQTNASFSYTAGSQIISLHSMSFHSNSHEVM